MTLLDLSFNDISSISSKVSRLTNIKNLFLHGNNLPSQEKMTSTFSSLPKPSAVVLTTENRLSINEVIAGLYISDAFTAKYKYHLKSLGITHILTVADIPPPHPKHFNYHVIPLLDIDSSNLAEHFEVAHQFINSARNNGSGVLVHW